MPVVKNEMDDFHFKEGMFKKKEDKKKVQYVGGMSSSRFDIEAYRELAFFELR